MMALIRRLAIFCVGLACTASTALHAQSATPPSGRAVSLARYAPASSKLFVRTQRLSDVHVALQRTHAWRLYPLFAGVPGGVSPPDLSAALAAWFGPSGAVGAQTLMNCEVALVAPSWQDLSRAVWLIRLPDAGLLERWYPPERRVGEARAAGVTFFHTADGFSVSVRDDVAAVGRRVRGRSLLRDVRTLMVQGAAGEGSSLERVSRFREFLAYLPARELAYAYVAFEAEEPGALGGIPGNIDRLMLGLYEREGRLDVALRASRRAPKEAQGLAEETLERILRLPQTTVAAVAMVADFGSLTRGGRQGVPDGVLRRYLSLLQGPGDPTADAARLPAIGPDVVLAWGQDLAGESSRPQFALLVHSADASAAHRFTSDTVVQLLDLLAVIDPEGAEALPEVEYGAHLGTQIEFVALDDYAKRSPQIVAGMLTGLTPAWAAWNDWLIVASHRDYLERILDAQLGLAPTLAALSDVQDVVRVRAERSVLALVQGADAAEMLSRWVAAVDAGRPSLLTTDASFGSGQPSGLPLMHGVVFSDDEADGGVVVDSVEEAWAARVPLRVDDWIIGADGLLLDMEAPFEHLQELLGGHLGPAPVMLRIIRGSAMLDVAVAAEALRYPERALYFDPLPALRELVSLGRTLQFASWSVHALDGARVSARLSLRFSDRSESGSTDESEQTSR